MTDEKKEYIEILGCGHENDFAHLIVTLLMVLMFSRMEQGVDIRQLESDAIDAVRQLFEMANTKQPAVPREILADDIKITKVYLN